MAELSAADSRRALRAELQVHVLRSRPVDGARKDCFRDSWIGVVVASCSPHMHLRTFRKAAQAAGLNPYLVEMANIREHCSWVHHDREQATAKAVEIIRLAVEKVRNNDRARAYSRSGHAARAGDRRGRCRHSGGAGHCRCRLRSGDGGARAFHRRQDGRPVGDLPHARLLAVHPDAAHGRSGPAPAHQALHAIRKSKRSTDSSATSRSPSARRRATSTSAKCTGCGECLNVCPLKRNPSEFDYGMGMRPAIYIPFPQAVPARPVIDKKVCAKLIRNGCGLCEKKCAGRRHQLQGRGQAGEGEGRRRGAGHRLQALQHRQGAGQAKLAGYGEYGYGKYKDVIDSLQFERLVSASGPTGGEIKRPSDGEDAEERGVHQLRGLARQRQGTVLLLQDLLHVHGQAHHALQAQSA